jgi:hypothetical protein
MYSENRAKIIPFPGVSLNQDNGFQITLDGFLKEMGYVKDKTAPEVRGLPENNVDNFLRKMGYVE